MSTDKLCKESMRVPPAALFEKKILNQSLSIDETKQVYDFSLSLTYLQDYGSASDEANITYVAQFFSYFCDKYDDYSSLPNQLKSGFDVAYYSDEKSFMNIAYNRSNCGSDFMDNLKDNFDGEWI